MFEGKKTTIFWIGLLILALASYFLFSTIWDVVSNYVYYANHPQLTTFSTLLTSMVPSAVGAVIFILVGAFMMKSGVKKEGLTEKP